MTHRILIITNDAAIGGKLAAICQETTIGAFSVEQAERLADGLERLGHAVFDAILADLSPPDSQGMAAIGELLAIAPQIPILAIAPTDDDKLAAEAVAHGAQDYLPKAYCGHPLLPHMLHSSIRRKAIEQSLFIEKTRTETALDHISEAIIGTDQSGHINYLNLAAENMTGWSREEARGQAIGKVLRIIDSHSHQATPNPVELTLQQDKTMTLEAGAIMLRRDGSETAIEYSVAPLHDAVNRLIGAIMIFHDITAAQAVIAKMAYLAQHDALTNLPNRVLLDDRITQAIAWARRHGTKLALLFLDLDNFKHINDSLGHATGDKLLQSVAQRLRGCVRSSDTISRLGGDEFVILVMQDKYAQNAVRTADKILAALATPHAIDEHDLHVTTSIGISVYPVDGQDAETLIKHADIAMYHAKEKGRNNYQFFKDEMNVRVVERLAIETHLHHALARDEFILHYQPKFSLKTGRIIGAEALLRWMHPEWGLLRPERFLQIAEDCGMILPIGRWVLHNACAQARRWEKAKLQFGSLAINISALEFRHKDFISSIAAVLSETGLPPHRLQLEIAEGVLMRDVESSLAILKQLKDMGIQLALDDFGTGCSSLKHLHRLPIDILKIDHSFIQAIGDSNGTLVSAAIAMGASLKQRTTAEGIEKPEQLIFLRTQHCDEGQGNLFSQPLAAGQFSQLLASGCQLGKPRE